MPRTDKTRSQSIPQNGNVYHIGSIRKNPEIEAFYKFISKNNLREKALEMLSQKIEAMRNN